MIRERGTAAGVGGGAELRHTVEELVTEAREQLIIRKQRGHKGWPMGEVAVAVYGSPLWILSGTEGRVTCWWFCEREGRR